MNSLLDDNNSMLLQEHEMSSCSEVGTRMSLRISSSSVNVGFVQLAQKFIDIVAQRCKVDDKVSRNFCFFREGWKKGVPECVKWFMYRSIISSSTSRLVGSCIEWLACDMLSSHCVMNEPEPKSKRSTRELSKLKWSRVDICPICSTHSTKHVVIIIIGLTSSDTKEITPKMFI